MNNAEMREFLGQARTIAVVGLSDKPQRASHSVAQYLQNVGYQIIPVNPTIDEVLGEQAVDSLSDIDGQIDIVDIFRRSEEVGPIVDEAIRIGARMVWMQLGVIDEDAARKAREAGLHVVMDKCLKVEHARLGL